VRLPRADRLLLGTIGKSEVLLVAQSKVSPTAQYLVRPFSCVGIYFN